MTQPISLIADLVDLLDVDLRYEYEERAGIIEFDGGTPRDDAEVLALVDLLRTYPDALVGMTVIQVQLNGKTEFVLTTKLEITRQYLDGQDATSIRVADLADVIKVQFGGMAFITPLHKLPAN